MLWPSRALTFTLPQLLPCSARAICDGALPDAAAAARGRSSGGTAAARGRGADAGGGFRTPAVLAAASVDAVASILRSERAYETPSVVAGSAAQAAAVNMLSLEQRFRVQAAGLIHAAKLTVAEAQAAKLRAARSR